MLAEVKVGQLISADGSINPARADRTNAAVNSDIHGRYLESIRQGNVFMLSAAAAGGTAYVGAAGGTPLLAVHNPAGSGKILSLLMIALGLRAQGSVAGQTALAAWAGASVLPTGTVTPARSALTYVAGGATGVGFSNTALTGSTALTLALPVATYYWATAASAFLAATLFDVQGIVAAIAGNQIAIGLTTIPTSLTVDVAMFWEEIAA